VKHLCCLVWALEFVVLTGLHVNMLKNTCVLLRLFFKMTHYVSSGMLNSVHSMAVFWVFAVS